jgi:hypothetical protein
MMWSARRKAQTSKHLPNFMGIGAPRSGTTWLWQNLRLHPGCFLPDAKELHFFDRQEDWRDLDRYARSFRKATSSQVKGEVTPAYGHLPVERILFLRERMPDLRLIYLLRNPVERSWSSAMKWLAKEGVWDPQSGFNDATDRKVRAHFEREGNRLRGDYVTNLKNWRGVFPAEQLLVRFHEEVRDEPERLMHDVFRHIGVTDDIDLSGFPLRKTVNATRNSSVPMPDVYRAHLQGLHSDTIEALYSDFGQPVSHWRV